MQKPNITIRTATINDHPGVNKYALKLVHQHQNFNPLRFVEFENHEQQLFDFFAQQIVNPQAVVLVVEVENEIVGYSFIRLEESSLVDMSWSFLANVQDFVLENTIYCGQVSHHFFPFVHKIPESCKGLGTGIKIDETAKTVAADTK